MDTFLSCAKYAMYAHSSALKADQKEISKALTTDELNKMKKDFPRDELLLGH